MRHSAFFAFPFSFFLAAGTIAAQAPAKVDYARDIQPLLRQNCVSCHGPMKQNGGMRLDRKSSAMKAVSRRIVPGNSANSFVYHRVADTDFGQPMPPTGELKPEQVALIKNWIDQGAEWPDSLANELELAALDLDAIAAVDKLHNGDVAGFIKMMGKRPSLLNARGPEGSSPFMYAVLYTNAATVGRLLKMGADPNVHNDAHATALMWGVHDLEKARLLVAHGANVNAVSDDFRTPLMIAARSPGGVPVVKLLLEHGANPNPNAHPEGASSPLLEAATVGNAEAMRLLLVHGAKIKGEAEMILTMSVTGKCGACVDLAVANIEDKDAYTAALQDTAVYGDSRSVKLMLDHGADAKAFDPTGRTALMYAAASDLLPLETVKLLVARGADVNARSKHNKSGDAGLTVLDVAKRHGASPVLDFLVASGAKSGPATLVALHPRTSNDIRKAIQDSLPLLQTADEKFSTGSGCVSCHNNSLSAMTMGAARKQGFQIDEKLASKQVKANVEFMAKTRDLFHQGFLLPVGDNFSEGVLAYILLGLDAEGYKADLDTDAAAMHILWRQQSNGEWAQPNADIRQPLCLNYIAQTALSMRALQLYAPKTETAAYRKSVELAATWLANAQSFNNDDRGWRVAGLAWAGNKIATQKAIQELVAMQKSDGGWSDLPSMESTAYATGKSLVALHIGGMAASDPVYKRGVKWLLDNQQQDGSWYVQTRAMGFQPSFDAGFPHGSDQFISAAGTNWAAQALTYALPETKNVTASVERGTD